MRPCKHNCQSCKSSVLLLPLTPRLTRSYSCVDSILINGKGGVHCPPLSFLTNETQPGVQASIDNQTVTDKR